MTNNKIDGKTILVSGGCGSIGSALVEKLIKDHSPKQVRVLDNNEAGLFQSMRQYSGKKQARFLLGDIRDKDRVVWAMKNVDVVFHAAALKHVELNEYSPFESVKTNVLGTQNMLEAALNNQVKTFVNISTDKAANPTSTMGASKLLAERLTVGANYFKGSSPTIFTSVRFGNVLNSSGSVLPIWLDQLKKGESLTITDKNMVRYFMTIGQAVELIFKAVEMAQGGEIFILKMPALKITDLAEVLLEKFGRPKTKVKFIGKRPGEKLYEKIVTRTEAQLALELKDMYVLPTAIDYPNISDDIVRKSFEYFKNLGGKPVSEEGIQPEKLMAKEEIKNLLSNIELQ